MGLRGRPRKATAQRYDDGRTRVLYDEVERQGDLAHQVDALRSRLGLGALSKDEWDLLTTIAVELRRGVISRRRSEGKPVKPPREYSQKDMAKLQRGWRAANPDKARENRERRQLRMKDGLTSAQVKVWAAEQVKVCRWCKTDCGAEFHVDHVVPLARGGAHERHNLCISCPPCNLSKGAKDPLVFQLETIVARGT